MKKKQPCKKLKKIVNRLVLKNLAICLGISLAVGSIGCPVGELFSEQVEAATTFADDASIKDYSREAVENLVSIGSIKGYPDDNTFRPQGTITRVEYLSMAMNAVDPTGSARKQRAQEMKNKVVDGLSYYDDVKGLMSDDIAEVWSGKAEEMLIVSRNIIAGAFDSGAEEVNGKSGWLAPITRAEAAQMLVACMEQLGGEKLEIKENIESKIADWTDNMSPESKNEHYNTVKGTSQREDIRKLYSAGIVKGNEQGAYQPQYNLTREQAAQTIYLAVNKDKRSAVDVAPLPKEEKRAATTIDLTDPNRITALPGDTVIDANGNKHVVGEIAGVPYIKGMALDLGRNQLSAGGTVKDRTTNDTTIKEIRLGDRYIVSPNGTGLWQSQWDTLIDYYVNQQDKKGPGTAGQSIRVGDDGWLELQSTGKSWIECFPDWYYE